MWTWRPGRPCATHHADGGEVFGPTTLVRLRHLSAAANGQVLALGDAQLCRMTLSESTPESEAAVIDALVDADGNVYALQQRDRELWLLDLTTRRELRVITEVRARTFHVIDGSGRLLVVGADGQGSLVDVGSNRASDIRVTPGINSVVTHEGTFWLADRLGVIYRLGDDGSVHVDTRIDRQRAAGGVLFPFQDSLVWRGTTGAMSDENPYGDPCDVLLFFRPMPRPSVPFSDRWPRLEESGSRLFRKADGVLRLLLGDPVRKHVLAFFRGQAEFGFCAKVGTPEDYMRKEERTIGLDFSTSIIDGAYRSEDDSLYCCANKDIVVLDPTALRVQGRLSGSRPFTSIIGNAQRRVVAVEAGARLYECQLEAPAP
jgi:hypothetical protein